MNPALPGGRLSYILLHKIVLGAQESVKTMRIHRRHNLGIEEARRRVDELAAELGGQFHLSSRWEGDDLQVRGSGVKGHISVTDSEVEVHIRLGLALAMLGGTIRSTIEDRIDGYLS